MIWQIILLIIIFLIIIPIPIKVKLKFNVLRLSGKAEVRIFKIFNYKIGVRFRGQYVFITTRKGTKREKLSAKNFNIAFVVQYIRQIYFRIIIKSLNVGSEEGYANSAMATALMCSITDVLFKCISARIIHNKKYAHIFVSSDTKYNEDCLRMKLESQCYISIFDAVYSLINSYVSLKGEEYERTKSSYEPYQEFD